MFSIEWLEVLFWISIVFSALLALLSTMAVGKHFAEIQYQREKGLNGIRWIQSIMNLRIHGNRVFFALAFATVSILALFDIDVYVRTWTGRVLFLSVLLIFFLSALLDWRDERKQLAILLKYEDINNIAKMRLQLHVLISRLAAYYGHVELTTVDEETRRELENLQCEMKALIKDIQKDLHKMDPTYRQKEDI